MLKIKYISITTDDATLYQNGHTDSNKQIPEELVSDGSGVPCRHCLTDIDKGEACKLLSYRPFPGLNAYAETGPIFIHANPCKKFSCSQTPEIINNRKQIMIRGYDKDNRIIEGTGRVINTNNIEKEALDILSLPSVEYLHIRSVTNNCYFCRAELEH